MFTKRFPIFDKGSIPNVDFHMNTKWTDGEHTVVQMHDAALAGGLDHIVFSEHARKTSGDWFPRFAAEVRELPADKCRAWVGVESKIESFEGTLDLSDEVRGLCDV